MPVTISHTGKQQRTNSVAFREPIAQEERDTGQVNTYKNTTSDKCHEGNKQDGE